jgi:hypothetical protein
MNNFNGAGNIKDSLAGNGNLYANHEENK